MAKNFDVRVRRLGTVPAGLPVILRADTIDYATALSDAATLAFTAQQMDAANGLIPDGTELAVEVWNGSVWAEPAEMSRFTVTERSYDLSDPTLATNFTCVDWGSFRLAKALLSAQEAREFNGTPGLILRTLITEARTRGWTSDLTFTFTDTKDSAGANWPKPINIDIAADTSILDTLGVLRDGGYIDWTVRGHQLYVTAKETSGARHKFTIGSHRKTQPERTSINDYATAVVLKGDDGREVRKTGNTGLGLGTLERAANASGVRDTATLDLLASAELAAGAPKTELTVTEDSANPGPMPLRDYLAGDYVWVRRNGTPEEVRVSGVQVRRAVDSTVSLDVMLMDRLSDNAARLAKKAKSLGNVAGNGRAKTSGGGGGTGTSGRYGTVDPSYVRDSGHPVLVDFGGAELEGPFSFLSSYRPGGGDRVMVVGSTVLGRVTTGPGAPGDPSIPPSGSVEVLEPGPRWQNHDAARFGDLRITKTSSDWVVLSGVLKRTSGTSSTNEVVAYIPSAYRPQRNLLKISAAYEDGSSRVELTLNMTTGALTIPSGYSRPISLAWAWNIRTDGYMPAESGITFGGVDIHGTAFMIARTETGTGDYTRMIPEGYRPARVTTLGLTPGQSAFVRPTGEATASRDMGPYSDYRFWQVAGTTAYEWEQLNPINGYSHHPDEPLEFTRTPAGIVMLRGLNGGGGISGQTVAFLPEGYRPSYEIILPNGIRITPGGAISGMSASPGASGDTSNSTNGGKRYLHGMFLAGR